MADDVRKFFEAYGASFRVGPSAVAEFYHEPCITARMGATQLNVTRRDTEEFFAKALEAYRSKGFADGAMLSLDSRAAGSNSTIATARWVYKDNDGKPLWEWTFTYNLYKSDGRWRILLQTMHDA